MKGVVICLGGYENPKRGQLREAAMKMGAQYRPDFSSDVTHLCCAFAGDTPKIRSARSSGKALIVEGDWITECKAANKRLDEGKAHPEGIRGTSMKFMPFFVHSAIP